MHQTSFDNILAAINASNTNIAQIHATASILMLLKFFKDLTLLVNKNFYNHFIYIYIYNTDFSVLSLSESYKALLYHSLQQFGFSISIGDFLTNHISVFLESRLANKLRFIFSCEKPRKNFSFHHYALVTTESFFLNRSARLFLILV